MVIEEAQFCDLEDILSLQKLAFQSEAKLFNDYSITPLTQSLESIEENFKNNLYLKAVHDGKILGLIRAFEKENICYIGRLIVHPDHQNKGIGKSLMYHIEELFNGCMMYSLYTAKRVSKNLYFYNKLGYSIVEEEKVNEKLTFVFYNKNNCMF
jgi:N-acetylglutamate synthase-like GNAT family acetyltransferase